MSEGFSAAFGRIADAVAQAPGRVNLLGEHTDYNDGYVLPIAIPQRTWVALGPAPRPGITLVAQSLGERVQFAFPATHGVEYGQHLLEEGVMRRELGDLRQIAH